MRKKTYALSIERTLAPGAWAPFDFVLRPAFGLTALKRITWTCILWDWTLNENIPIEQNKAITMELTGSIAPGIFCNAVSNIVAGGWIINGGGMLRLNAPGSYEFEGISYNDPLQLSIRTQNVGGAVDIRVQHDLIFETLESNFNE